MLLSCSGLMKLCDFGFARMANRGEALSEYVATRCAARGRFLCGAGPNTPASLPCSTYGTQHILGQQGLHGPTSCCMGRLGAANNTEATLPYAPLGA